MSYVNVPSGIARRNKIFIACNLIDCDLERGKMVCFHSA